MMQSVAGAPVGSARTASVPVDGSVSAAQPGGSSAQVTSVPGAPACSRRTCHTVWSRVVVSGPAEGDLAQRRVLDRRSRCRGPHVDVGDVHARVGRRGRRAPRAVGAADDGRAGRQVGLGEHRRERLVLAEHPVDVVAPGRQPEVGAGGDQPEPRRVDRRAGGADDVEQRGAAEVGVDVLLLVPIGVEVDAALLLADARGVAPGVERRCG